MVTEKLIWNKYYLSIAETTSLHKPHHFTTSIWYGVNMFIPDITSQTTSLPNIYLIWCQYVYLRHHFTNHITSQHLFDMVSVCLSQTSLHKPHHFTTSIWYGVNMFIPDITSQTTSLHNIYLIWCQYVYLKHHFTNHITSKTSIWYGVNMFIPGKTKIAWKCDELLIIWYLFNKCGWLGYYSRLTANNGACEVWDIKQ